MHARYYTFNLGRFMSVDPVGGTVGLSQSWNRYAYVRGNPVLRVDPDGRADGLHRVVADMESMDLLKEQLSESEFEDVKKSIQEGQKAAAAAGVAALSAIALPVAGVGGAALAASYSSGAISAISGAAQAYMAGGNASDVITAAGVGGTLGMALGPQSGEVSLENTFKTVGSAAASVFVAQAITNGPSSINGETFVHAGAGAAFAISGTGVIAAVAPAEGAGAIASTLIVSGYQAAGEVTYAHARSAGRVTTTPVPMVPSHGPLFFPGFVSSH